VNVSRSPRAARRPARSRGGAGWQSPPAAARGEARCSVLGGRAGASGGERGRARANTERGRAGHEGVEGGARARHACSRCSARGAPKPLGSSVCSRRR
jgi:hypothetical protein